MRSLSKLQARDVMTSPVAYVMSETPLNEVANLLLRKGISAAPVLDDGGHLVGMVSEGDLVRRGPAKDGDHRSWWLDLFESDAAGNEKFLNYLTIHGLRAKDVMTGEVVSVDEQTTIAQIATLLEAHQIKRVPVMRDGKLIGIVSRANLLRALAQAEPLPGRAAGSVRQRQRRRAGGPDQS
jgi:CBS domain-containing protein